MEFYLKRAYRSASTVTKHTQFISILFLGKLTELVVFITLAVYYYAESFLLFLTPSFLRSRKCLKGQVILVTGGAGGVGKELVWKLAKKGAKIVVWDNNEKAMEKLKEGITKYEYDVKFYTVDITDRNLVYKYAKIVKEDVGVIDVLINNAGIVCGQTFLDLPDYMIEKTYKVNILSHYWTTKAFLPDMIKKKEGHIVTVGSLTGLLGTYKCTDYSASKFATIGFHESLHCELMTHGHDYIKMTLVCPYFINTGMFDGCTPKNMPMLTPEEVAKRLITAVELEEVFITLPSFSRYIMPIKYWVPAKLGWTLIHKVVKGPQSMMGMRPFKEVEAA